MCSLDPVWNFRGHLSGSNPHFRGLCLKVVNASPAITTFDAHQRPKCMKGTQSINPTPESLRRFTASFSACAAPFLFGFPSLRILLYTSSATCGASLSLIDHIVAITPRYPAMNIPAAKWTDSSAIRSFPTAVSHAERKAKSARGSTCLTISESSRTSS